MSIITDCSPDFIEKELEKLGDLPNRVEIVVSNLVEKKNYPKLKDYLDKKNRLIENESLLKVNKLKYLADISNQLFIQYSFLV